MPYAPGVQPRGSDYLFQGISGAGQSLAEGITALKARTRQAVAMRQMAVDGLGMDPDQVDKMSLPQLTGTLQGEALKRSNIGQRILQENEMLKGQNQNLVNQVLQRRQRSTDVFNKIMGGGAPAAGGGPPPGFMGSQNAGGTPGSPDAGTGMNPANFMPGAGGAPPSGAGPGPGASGFDPQRVMQAMIQAGADPQDTLEMMNSVRSASQARRYEAQGNLYDARAMMDQNAGAGGAPPQFTEDPVSGARFATFGKDLIPSGVNPAKAQPTPAYDPDGNMVGYSVFDGKRNTIMKTANTMTGELTPAKANGQTVPGLFQDSAGAWHDLRPKGAGQQDDGLSVLRGNLGNLINMKATGVKTVKYAGGVPASADGWLSAKGAPIDDEITKFKNLVNAGNDPSAFQQPPAAAAGAPSPAKAPTVFSDGTNHWKYTGDNPNPQADRDPRNWLKQ